MPNVLVASSVPVFLEIMAGPGVLVGFGYLAWFIFSKPAKAKIAVETEKRLDQLLAQYVPADKNAFENFVRNVRRQQRLTENDFMTWISEEQGAMNEAYSNTVLMWQFAKRA